MEVVTPRSVCPEDKENALLTGRAWLPAPAAGPALVLLDGDLLRDITALGPTMSALLDRHDLASLLGHDQRAAYPEIGRLDAALAAQGNPEAAHLLAPCDLQAVKACGVTFAASMLERVVEEQAKGDPERAQQVRDAVTETIGDDLSKIVPGSAEAEALKDRLLGLGAWSQYLEVGIGPYAEVFTKAQPLSAVGTGAGIGIHPESQWSNPEPEIVLAVNGRGEIVGASLGNDLNLRDFEGRSALLLSKAKDNNASCAIGPFIRLFDQRFTLDQVRAEDVQLEVRGDDGYHLEDVSSMAMISRDPADLVAETIGRYHQYPDGFVLFLGTMFAPVDDRGGPGLGFTHKPGDLVTVHSKYLGALNNRIDHCDRLPPWTFGAGALMANLARRGLL